MTLSIFGCFSSDIAMKTNWLNKIWGAFGFSFVLLVPDDLYLWQCHSQPGMWVWYMSAAALHMCIFLLFILGTLMVQDFLSPCCNAACQFGRLIYTGPRPLPFLSCLNALFWHACQQVWSGVKSQVAQKWRGCHIGWTSHSWNSTFCGTAQDVCM